MNITLNQYVENPMREQGSVFSSSMRQNQQKEYAKKFSELLLREAGNIDFTLYKTNKEEYIIHIKIPSESLKGLYYDVVFRFFPNPQNKDGVKSLANYYVQFFSNDPAFMFNYANTFIKKGIFFKDLTGRISEKAVKDAAKIKNPDKIVGYVKSLYFGYLFMKQKGLFFLNQWETAEDYNKSKLINNVVDADDKIKELQSGITHEKNKKARAEKSSALKKESHTKRLSPDNLEKFSVKKSKVTKSTTKSKTIKSQKKKK